MQFIIHIIAAEEPKWMVTSRITVLMNHSVNEIIIGQVDVYYAFYPEILHLPGCCATLSHPEWRGVWMPRKFYDAVCLRLAASVLALQSKSLLLTGSEKLGFGLLCQALILGTGSLEHTVPGIQGADHLHIWCVNLYLHVYSEHVCMCLCSILICSLMQAEGLDFNTRMRDKFKQILIRKRERGIWLCTFRKSGSSCNVCVIYLIPLPCINKTGEVFRRWDEGHWRSWPFFNVCLNKSLCSCKCLPD